MPDRLRKNEWMVQPIMLKTAQQMVEAHHYAKGGSNTATYCHGLFRRDASFWENDCKAIAWWIPPTKSAALATFPEYWQGVLSLTRMVVLPGVPNNACSFLLSKSMKLIDRSRWPCLVTYADEAQGHTGKIYEATNWAFVGRTKPEAIYVKEGRMMSRKGGARTRTRCQMEAIGAELVGRSRKRKFVHIR